MLLLGEDLHVREPSGKEQSERWQAGSQRQYFLPQTSCSRLSQDTIRIPSGPSYLPFQPQTHHAAVSPNAMHYTWEGSCVLAAITWLTQHLVKLLQAARQPEVRSHSSGAQSQHSSAGNTCSLSCYQREQEGLKKLLHFLFLPFSFPPHSNSTTSFGGISHYVHCISTLKSNKETISPPLLAFPFPWLITISPIVKGEAGRILFLCYSHKRQK